MKQKPESNLNKFLEEIFEVGSCYIIVKCTFVSIYLIMIFSCFQTGPFKSVKDQNKIKKATMCKAPD
jgi:hypothetical protein